MMRYYKIPQDYLIYRGNERLDLIHRLSTNDVVSLKKSQFRKTILTSDKGRMIDILNLFNFGDFVFVSCSPNSSQKVLEHLDKYTIMDDFKPQDMTGTHESVLFFGDNVDRFIKEILGLDVESVPNEFSIYSKSGKDAIIFSNDEPIGGAFVIYASEDKSFYEEMLFNSSVCNKFNMKEIDNQVYDILRIESGIPAYGKEVTEEINPLECGLQKYVSFTKGCYIGQEVISRLDTYDKISKHLVGIHSNSNFGEVTGVVIRTKEEDSECGFLTSSAVSRNFGNIGLGFVKTPYINYDKDFKLQTKNGSYDCKLVKLPFTNVN